MQKVFAFIVIISIILAGWFQEGLKESYPAQGTIGKLEVIPSKTPEGADLSESEALNKALDKETLKNNTLAVPSILYNSNKDKWTIVLKDTNSFKEQVVQVDDK